MHQPYYKNLLTNEVPLPWVRLHGIKDYLDMILMLKEYPKMRATFNLVPCLIEQIQDYANEGTRDRYLDASYKEAQKLSEKEKQFLMNNFFQIYPKYGIKIHPRYYQLYLKKEAGGQFDVQELRDLQVWFNLAWFDPHFRKSIPGLRLLVKKARFFSEEDKRVCLDAQRKVLSQTIPAYKRLQDSGQIEVITNPYYHPILPLLFNSESAQEANPKAESLLEDFSFPQDAEYHINAAVQMHRQSFGCAPRGMWPSEEAVSEGIIPAIAGSGINWIITDEAMLFKSLKKKTRDTSSLYRPYCLRRGEDTLNIVFRDRNLSDLIGFVYNRLKPKEAVADFMSHLKNIHTTFKNGDPLVVIAMDGENAWEYFKNDGWDFLGQLYHQLCAADFINTTTVSDYLAKFPPRKNIKYLKPGSWVDGNFNKWIGSNPKNKAWKYLLQARKDLQQALDAGEEIPDLAWKQMYVAEGSDWFWWYGDTDDTSFDELFRMHLSNFYRLLNKPVPEYLHETIT